MLSSSNDVLQSLQYFCAMLWMFLLTRAALDAAAPPGAAEEALTVCKQRKVHINVWVYDMATFNVIKNLRNKASQKDINFR